MKPILFNTEMVRAILEGRKTVTRRVALPARELRPFKSKDYPDGWWFRGRVYETWDDAMRSLQGVMRLCRYRPGDILYVRETWCINQNPNSEGFGGYEYRADYDGAMCQDLISWKPSIHMPKEAARMFLRVLNVRVERLQDITEEQARAEGAKPFALSFDPEGTPEEERTWHEVEKARDDFITLWDSTVKKADLPRYGWDANPWVWVIGFERISKKEALS